ncbi:unnamed protein product [Strongylus vulgaris]|uniref:Uncharacterized protein n=1 Tax=Strongylus vulgaris TaxID=40348 RepID=A0A3P7IPV7_STRVU|nr:unnamed protein product [Strongylus vulgaris]
MRMVGTEKAHGSRSIHPMDKHNLSRSHKPFANCGRAIETILRKDWDTSGIDGLFSTVYHSHGSSDEKPKPTASMGSPVCNAYDAALVAENRKELEDEVQRWKD